MTISINGEMDEIAQYWPLNMANYPLLPGMREDYARHIILHQTKDTGRMAAALEPHDHGRPIDEQLLRRSLRNSLVNMLRLCDLFDWTPAALLADYKREMARHE